MSYLCKIIFCFSCFCGENGNKNLKIMKSVYKYPLKVEDEQEVNLPLGAQVLSANFQGDILCIWALVDADEDFLQPQTVYIHGTGHHLIDNNSRFINTVFIDSLVFHVFVRNY